MGSKARADPLLPARLQWQAFPGTSECGDARNALKGAAASRIELFAISADATPIVDRTIGQMRLAHCAVAFPRPGLSPRCLCARRRPRHIVRASDTPFRADAQPRGRPPHRTNPLNAVFLNAQTKVRSCAPELR